MPRSAARSTTSLAGKLRARLRTNAALSPCRTTNPAFAVAFFFPAFFFFEAICCCSLVKTHRGSEALLHYAGGPRRPLSPCEAGGDDTSADRRALVRLGSQSGCERR